MSNDPALKAIEKLDKKLDEYGQGLIALADAVDRHTKLIEDIHKACTAARPTSPHDELLRQLATNSNELKEGIRDLVDAVESLPDAVNERLSRKSEDG